MRSAEERFASIYIRRSPFEEERGGSEHRARLLEGIRGRVLDLGAGHGLNFAHFAASDVVHVAALEPNALLRSAASDAAGAFATPSITIVDGVGEALPFLDSTFDAVVMALVLCTVRHPQTVLSEIRRVLRPEGELRFYEHTVSERRPLALLQKVAEPAWKQLAGGCRLTRDPLELISRSGFTIVKTERFWFSPRLSSSCVGDRVLGIAVPDQ